MNAKLYPTIRVCFEKGVLFSQASTFRVKSGCITQSSSDSADVPLSREKKKSWAKGASPGKVHKAQRRKQQV